jgi:hypothetical protein
MQASPWQMQASLWQMQASPWQMQASPWWRQASPWWRRLRWRGAEPVYAEPVYGVEPVYFIGSARARLRRGARLEARPSTRSPHACAA